MSDGDIGSADTDRPPPDIMGTLADILEQLGEVKGIVQGLANEAFDRGKRLADLEATVSDMGIEVQALINRAARQHRTDAE